MGRRFGAEAIGTLLVMFTGSVALLVGGPRLGEAGIALAFGVAIALVSGVIAPISGAHMNPAVTLAHVALGRTSPREAFGCVAAQLAGGVVGARMAIEVAAGRPGGMPLAASALVNGYDALSPGSFGFGAALVTEVTLTALLVLAMLGASGSARLPAVAGGAYALAVLVGRPVTNLAANPARALGPALFAGGAALGQVWLFFVAPAAGALLAAAAHRVLFAPSRPAR